MRKWIWIFKTISSTSYAKQHSGTSTCGWTRLYTLISSETIHKISSTKNMLNIHIKFYFWLSLYHHHLQKHSYNWNINELLLLLWKQHCVERVPIQSYSGPHFSRIFKHSDWIRRDTLVRKMRTRIYQISGLNYFAHFGKL